MEKAPQVEPISKLRRDHVAVLSKLKKGPVFLAQHGTLTAAMISIEEWNKIAKRLDHLETLARARRISNEMNNDPTIGVSHEELMKRLGVSESLRPPGQTTEMICSP